MQKWENAKQEKKEKAGTLHVGWVNRDPCAAWEYRQMAEKLAASGDTIAAPREKQRMSETPFTATAVAIAKATAHAHAGESDSAGKERAETLTSLTSLFPADAKKAAGHRRVENHATAASIMKAGESIGCYSMRLASDNETAFSRFIQYLLDRFKSLAAAWDAMDPQDTGEVTRVRFCLCCLFQAGLLQEGTRSSQAL